MEPAVLRVSASGGAAPATAPRRATTTGVLRWTRRRSPVDLLEYGVQVSRGGWVSQSSMVAVLADAYGRTPGGYVAFLDESFELEGDRTTFYLMSAVVTHREQIEDLRDGLRDVVGGDYWHTTESLRTEGGRKSAVEVAEYLGDEKGSEVCIVSCKSPIGSQGADAARQACFQQVAATLCSGARPLAGSVHLMVLEQRETQHERSYDAKIVKDLRAAAVICRYCQLKQASPRDEPLLWLPDLVSSAVRRSLTHQEHDLLDPIERIVTLLD
jgi:hypothetical protein